MRPAPSPDDIAAKLQETPPEQIGRYLAELADFGGCKTSLKEPPQIVLGSRSPRRELILSRLLDIKHNVLVVEAHEHLPTKPYPPDIVSKCLTVQKFIAYVSNIGKIREMGNILIVSDTVVVGENGEIIGKEPENLSTVDEKFQYCRSRIKGYMGKPTIVYSSIIIADLRAGRVYLASDSVVIHFRKLDDSAETIIKAYCSHIFDEGKIRNHRGPIGKAGSFGIQEPEVIYLVEKIEGDITVAVGLPAELILNMLNGLPGARQQITMGRTGYDPERCVDTIFANCHSSEDLPSETNLRAHALDLISNRGSNLAG